MTGSKKSSPEVGVVLMGVGLACAGLGYWLYLKAIRQNANTYSGLEKLAQPLADHAKASVTVRASSRSSIEARFLPILRLHPDDEYRPALVSWLLPRAELRFKGNDTPILKKGQITDENLAKQSFNGKSSGGGQEVTDFYIDYPDDADRDATRRGNIDEFACYVHITRRNDPMEIQYWFYYPYNGSIAPALDIAHEGDWEHITVRLKPDRSAIDKIFYYAHKNGEPYSRWVPAAGHVNAQGRPVVYSAYHTHGSYPRPGKWPTPGGVEDETKDGGPQIDYNADFAWRSLDVPAPLFDWINFNGRWGKPGVFEASSGFPGPKFQENWKEDPRE